MNHKKVGRNDPCPCGSGKKYKNCCMNKGEGVSHPQSPRTRIEQGLRMASAYLEAGQFLQAEQVCHQIIQLDSATYQAYTLLGIVAYYGGNHQASINWLLKSIEIHPAQPDAHNNLAAIYTELGKFEQALKHIQYAIRLNPKQADAHVNHGNLLQDLYRFDEAAKAYQQALKINASHTGALSNLANNYQQRYLHTLAIETFQKLLSIDKHADWAIGGLLYSKIHTCDWADYHELIARIKDDILQDRRPIKVFELRPASDDPALELKCARAFSEYMYPSKSLPRMPAKPERDASKKMRVAYVSADFRQHPVGQLLVEIIEKHDRLKFEVFGVSLGMDDQSALRARLSNAFDTFVDARGMSDLEVAMWMREKNIDVTIDLMGYTTDARPNIFSYRAAPLQVSYLGYSGTTGAPYMDYLLADEVIIPSDSQANYSEKVAYLPAPLLPRDTSVTASATKPTRAEMGLPENVLVFCVFNNHYKITPAIFSVWMRVLQLCEGSVLWLSKADTTIQNNLRKEASLRGVDPDRLVFAQRMERLEDHLARHGLADLFLDTMPYNAHTTSSDALWAGLPVVTCMGQTFVSRVAGSLLTSLGMTELITGNLETYEAKIVSLAQNPDQLTALKEKLARQLKASQAFDSTRYVQDLESALVEMVKTQ